MEFQSIDHSQDSKKSVGLVKSSRFPMQFNLKPIVSAVVNACITEYSRDVTTMVNDAIVVAMGPCLKRVNQWQDSLGYLYLPEISYLSYCSLLDKRGLDFNLKIPTFSKIMNESIIGFRS